jgi:hypothetical protein
MWWCRFLIILAPLFCLRTASFTFFETERSRSRHSDNLSPKFAVSYRPVAGMRFERPSCKPCKKKPDGAQDGFDVTVTSRVRFTRESLHVTNSLPRHYWTELACHMIILRALAQMNPDENTSLLLLSYPWKGRRVDRWTFDAITQCLPSKYGGAGERLCPMHVAHSSKSGQPEAPSTQIFHALSFSTTF